MNKCPRTVRLSVNCEMCGAETVVTAGETERGELNRVPNVKYIRAKVDQVVIIVFIEGRDGGREERGRVNEERRNKRRESRDVEYPVSSHPM